MNRGRECELDNLGIVIVAIKVPVREPAFETWWTKLPGLRTGRASQAAIALRYPRAA
jgi:hypothetical protein